MRLQSGRSLPEHVLLAVRKTGHWISREERVEKDSKGGSSLTWELGWRGEIWWSGVGRGVGLTCKRERREERRKDDETRQR